MIKKLWQLKRISTNEGLNEPQVLPDNWGPVYGLPNFIDRLNDLTWLGYPDLGWFEVGEYDDEPKLSPKEVVDSQVKHLLQESLEKVAADNLNISKGERIQWIEYRKALKEIHLQPGYPNEIFWPKNPNSNSTL